MSKPISELNSPEEIRSHLVSKAVDDLEFRDSLIADPKGAIQAELEVEIPASVKVSVVEDSANEIYLWLPPSDRIPNDTLNEISGGQTYCESNGSGCY